MKVELLSNTRLFISARAIRKCRANENQSDTDNWNECGEKDRELIDRIGNKFKHSSTLEHLNYTFEIDGISRALLQELARHRIASITVKSSRYTMKELLKTSNINDCRKFLVSTGDKLIDDLALGNLWNARKALLENKSNDIAKYALPEAYKTSLVWTINARSLQNFLSLRTNKDALWEIRKLGYSIFNNLPEDHKYLFSENLYKS